MRFLILIIALLVPIAAFAQSSVSHQSPSASDYRPDNPMWRLVDHANDIQGPFDNRTMVVQGPCASNDLILDVGAAGLGDELGVIWANLWKVEFRFSAYLAGADGTVDVTWSRRNGLQDGTDAQSRDTYWNEGRFIIDNVLTNSVALIWFYVIVYTAYDGTDLLGAVSNSDASLSSMKARF